MGFKKDSQGNKYFLIDTEEAWPDGPEFEIRVYLKVNPNVNLEEIVKLNLIKNAPNIGTKMKLLNPNIYNNVRAFYLSFES